METETKKYKCLECGRVYNLKKEENLNTYKCPVCTKNKALTQLGLKDK